MIYGQYMFNVCCVGNEKIIVLWEFIGSDGNPLTGKDAENPLRTGGLARVFDTVVGENDDPCVSFQVTVPPAADRLRMSVVCFAVGTRKIVCSGQTHFNCVV